EYVLNLDSSEKQEAQNRKMTWAPRQQIVVGINTGCATLIPYKKMSIDLHRQLIEKLLEYENLKVVLLGGREDTQRNAQIAQGLSIVSSPTENGIRDGLISVEACDIVISGDSLGMHMAIALKKYVVAWFGPTCPQEIDLYGRGTKVLAQVGCGPCWKRSCHNLVMCYDQVPIDQILSGVQKGVRWISSSSKQHSSETFSSASPFLGL
ncbi:MAG: hypothetical protein KDD22_09095, partial [Bdellovibrionales bacterium]|nr:hypothetical protein [Bdellovibrionales bacterium]